MSTSLMFHGLGIRGYQLQKTKFKNGDIYFHVSQDKHNLRCPNCQSSKIIRRGTRTREFRSVPIGNKKTFIVLPAQRIQCKECNGLHYVKVPFAEPGRRYTRSFKQYAISLLQFSTIQDVAKHLGVGWDLVKEIDKSDLKKFQNPCLKDLKQIAIDEISIGKRHRYITVVLDIKTGAIVFLGDGKGADSLDPFWKKLKRSKSKIEAVATDMSPAYIKAVAENIPDAIHVADPFHIVKLFNDKLSELRRDIYNESSDAFKKKVLKGTRWLLLKNPENLVSKRHEGLRLKLALKLNEPLAAAYYLKEELRQMWSQKTKKDAECFILSWILRAEQSGVKMLINFSKTIRKFFRKILAHYDYPISTGILEGTNNKIKTLTKRSYGFRDQEYFKMKVMGIHRAKYQLIG